jgi:hypothetical protein
MQSQAMKEKDNPKKNKMFLFRLSKAYILKINQDKQYKTRASN